MDSHLTRREFLKKLGIAAAAVAVAPVVASCAEQPAPTAPPVATAKPVVAPTATAPAKKYVMRLSHTHAPGPTALDVFAVKFKELVAAKTNEAVEIQVFANAKLGAETEIIKLVQEGSVDMMASGTAIWGNLAPKIQILDLPFLFRDYDHIHRTFDGEVGQLLAKHADETVGVRPIAYFDSFGFRNVVTRDKEVKTVDDLKGLKLRTYQTPIYVKAVELMGATPMPIAFNEIYTALQTRVIDGYEHDANTTIAQKWFEYAKYTAQTGHIVGTLALTVNAKNLDALPANLKQAVMDAAKEAAVFQRTRAPIEDNLAFDELKKKGMVINKIDTKSLAVKAEPFWMSYSKDLQADDIVKKIIAA